MRDADPADPVDPVDRFDDDPPDQDPPGGGSPIEEFLDDLMPPELDWRRVVRRHPIPSLLVAAAAGYWLGHGRRGRVVVDALAGVVATGLVARLGDFTGDVDPAFDDD